MDFSGLNDKVGRGLRPIAACGIAFIVASASASQSAFAAGSQTPLAQQAASVESKEAVEKSIDSANRSLAAYKLSPDPVTWDTFWKDFRHLIEESSKKSVELSQVTKAVGSLNEFGFRMTDAPSLKVFSFTRAPESQQLLVAWRDSLVTKVAGAKGKGKGKGRKPAPTVTKVVPGAIHFQVLACPSSVFLNDARMISSASGESAGANGSKARPAAASASRYMVFCGADKKTGLAWLAGYRLYQGGWVQFPELFSGVPPYLLENVPGKPSFSGANLVFTSETLKPDGSSYQPDSGYKLVLRFFGDHYALDNKSSIDAAMTVAIQFSQAVQKGRVDMVKAWLVDPKLASIPSYLGLYNRPNSSPPFRLIGMAAPLNGGSRYRLITYDKNDLILDIAKIKAQWAVRGIYIAPADPVAKKLTGLPVDSKVQDGIQEKKSGKIEDSAN